MHYTCTATGATYGSYMKNLANHENKWVKYSSILVIECSGICSATQHFRWGKGDWIMSDSLDDIT